MKLLNEITVLLSDEKASLTDALLKMKVVMYAIGHKELAEWVTDELNGYPNGKAVPDFRIIGSRAVGILEDIIRTYPATQLPTSQLDDRKRKHLFERRVHQSISVVQGFAQNSEGHLTIPLAPEWFGGPASRV